MEEVFKGRLVASKVDWNGYTTYVFENEDNQKEEGRYIMCKRFPYWDAKEIHVDDYGFIKIRKVFEGDTYEKGGITNTYTYSDIHFISFVPIEKKETKDKDAKKRIGIQVKKSKNK